LCHIGLFVVFMAVFVLIPLDCFCHPCFAGLFITFISVGGTSHMLDCRLFLWNSCVVLSSTRS
jgi:hypothetical protein